MGQSVGHERACDDQRAYGEAEIAERLAPLPHWHCVDNALQRSFRTASFKAALMVATTVGHLCEAAWHHPELIVSFKGVVVRLWTHTAKGVTVKDFELAARIEDVVGWRPERQGGALTGPPDDPRHAYIRHD